MKEIWKDIEGWEGLYMISNAGKVRSFNTKGRGAGRIQGRPHLLKQNVTQGYLQVTLSSMGKRNVARVAPLVAKAFVPNPENKPQVNHKDGNKLNNSIDNLEWVTSSENVQHAYDTGLSKGATGEKSRLAKLNRFQVRRMRLMKEVDPKLTYVKLGEMFGINWRTARNIVNHKTWKYV